MSGFNAEYFSPWHFLEQRVDNAISWKYRFLNVYSNYTYIDVFCYLSLSREFHTKYWTGRLTVTKIKTKQKKKKIQDMKSRTHQISSRRDVICRCYIARYTHVWNRHNVHKMFMNIYMNPKTRNWFRYETFIPFFEFTGFSTWGQRHIIFLCWLLLHRQLSTQPTRGFCSALSRLTSPNSESLVRRQELNLHLFLKSPYAQPTLPVRDVTHISWSQFSSVIFILTSLNHTSSPRAREHLR